ncbi:MAG TPA: ABC transporter substrate-binding protein [Chloroflexota bacterium]|nr:ABC transporter substrate-binding protein [Chloroflexota bacterium]
MHRPQRKLHIQALLGAAALAASTACAPAAPPASAPTSAPTTSAASTTAPAAAAKPTTAAPAAAAPATAAPAAAAPSTAGRTLVVANSYTFTTKDTDPARGGVDFQADPFFHAVYDTLLTFGVGDNSAPKPLVAESYTSSPDARTFTFKLRKDVKFSDGTPLKAGDVAFSYNRLLNLHDTPIYLLEGVTGVSAPDDYTFVIETKDPNPAIPFIVTNPALGVTNSTVLKAHGGSDQPGAEKTDTAESYLQTASAGSGPYVMSGISTSQVEMKANPNYWGPNKPTFQNVVLRDVAAATQLIEVQRSTDEVVLSLSGDQAQSLKGNDKLNVNAFTSPNLTFLYVNVNPEVLPFGANAHFQQAVRYGIDYDALVKVAGAGAAQAPGVVPPQFLGALPLTSAVKRDLAKAKSELSASGLGSPAIQLDYQTTSTGQTEALAAKIQANLAEVGINVTLNGQPSAIATPNYRGGKLQMGLFGWAPDYPDPNNYLAFMPGQLVGKRAGWLVEAAPTLVELGNKAGATADNDTRAKMYRDIQTQLNQDSPIFPLINPGGAVVTTKNLTNVAYSPVWYIDFAAIGTN